MKASAARRVLLRHSLCAAHYNHYLVVVPEFYGNYISRAVFSRPAMSY